MQSSLPDLHRSLAFLRKSSLTVPSYGSFLLLSALTTALRLFIDRRRSSVTFPPDEASDRLVQAQQTIDDAVILAVQQLDATQWWMKDWFAQYRSGSLQGNIRVHDVPAGSSHTLRATVQLTISDATVVRIRFA